MNQDTYINNKQSLCSALRFKSIDSKSYDNEFLLINNGKIELLIDVSHGFDIAWLRYEGKLISALLSNGFNNNKIDFNSYFYAGFLFTAGLDSVGNRNGFPLHGNYHNTPAKIVEISEGENLKIVAEIEFTKFYGHNLTLKRTITTSYNANKVILDDQITNNLNKDDNYCQLYHINFGYPFINEDLKIKIKSDDVIARDDYANSGIKNALIIDKIKDNEQVYYHLNNDGLVILENNKLNIKLSIKYDAQKLPSLIEWKSLIDKNYALGIEPSTTYLDDAFKYSPIKAKETINHRLEFIFQ